MEPTIEEGGIYHDFDLNMETTIEEGGIYHDFDLNMEATIEEDDDSSGSELEEFAQETTFGTASTSLKKKNVSNDKRKAVYNMLMKKSVNGKLKKGTTKEVSLALSVPLRTVQRIWKRSKESSTGNVSNRRSNCGRKRIQVNPDQIIQIPLGQRTTLDSLACSLDVSRGKAFNLLKDGSIRRHSNAIKPFLKDENKRSRLRFCISMLEESSLSRVPTFKGMYNIIHIDEKWFNMTKRSENYYLLPNEEQPLRTCKSKNFIGKVMFLAAIARPRFDSQGNELFSGKIGIFPFVIQERAKRSSANRVAGTMEMKPITSVTRDIMRSYMIEKLLPAIHEKWPSDEIMNPIFIQQDNAKTHIDRSDNMFCEAAKEYGFDIRIMSQPANSPDLNILDLGFFRAIQSLQYKEAPKTVDELINAVVKSFEEFSTIKSNRIFLSLQQCMIEIMKVRGGHNYSLQHMKKAKLEREGKLPIQLECDATLVQDILQFLN